jgi:hypothetical protein
VEAGPGERSRDQEDESLLLEIPEMEAKMKLTVMSCFEFEPEEAKVDNK